MEKRAKGARGRMPQRGADRPGEGALPESRRGGRSGSRGSDSGWRVPGEPPVHRALPMYTQKDERLPQFAQSPVPGGRDSSRFLMEADPHPRHPPAPSRPAPVRLPCRQARLPHRAGRPESCTHSSDLTTGAAGLVAADHPAATRAHWEEPPKGRALRERCPPPCRLFHRCPFSPDLPGHPCCFLSQEMSFCVFR